MFACMGWRPCARCSHPLMSGHSVPRLFCCSHRPVSCPGYPSSSAPFVPHAVALGTRDVFGDLSVVPSVDSCLVGVAVWTPLYGGDGELSRLHTPVLNVRTVCKCDLGRRRDWAGGGNQRHQGQRGETEKRLAVRARATGPCPLADGSCFPCTVVRFALHDLFHTSRRIPAASFCSTFTGHFARTATRRTPSQQQRIWPKGRWPWPSSRRCRSFPRRRLKRFRESRVGRLGYVQVIKAHVYLLDYY